MSRWSAWPYEFERRDWQQRAFEEFRSTRLDNKDFLLVACPAAGKTRGVMSMVVDLLEGRHATRVVVISPTDEVCNQWVNSAAEFGVQLSRSGSETKDFDGVAVTYQQVINGSDTHRSLCRTHPTVVVFDEVHHCGEGLQWSDSIRRAFECAAFRIALSGTPFRSDDRPIPFVTYEDGVCRPDFTYSYQEAMDDGVCRLAFFPHHRRVGRMAEKRGAEEGTTDRRIVRLGLLGTLADHPRSVGGMDDDHHSRSPQKDG
jgi:superfamily II DNA or RNA helicase